MAVTKYNYLDELGLQQLATEILKSANSRIKERILTVVNDAAYTDEQRVLAAKAVLALIGKSTDTTGDTLYGRIATLKTAVGAKGDASTADTVYGAIAKTKEEVLATISGLTHLTYQTVTGAITTVTDPKTDVIYLQQDTAEDSAWNLYIYNETEWICVGDTSLTLENYWSKDDASVNELSAKILGKIDNATITSKVAAAFSATNPFAADASNAYVS